MNHQPQSAQTWFVTATIISGAKYIEKINSNINKAKPYETNFRIGDFCLSMRNSMNCAFLDGKVYQESKDT